jgi:Amt family ammonium transporter
MVSDADINSWYLIWGGICVFFMQTGFCMLECGSVRSKNSKNICVKNLLDSCVSTIAFWSMGWAFAYGTETDSDKNNDYMGHRGFFLAGNGYNNDGSQYANWFFQWAFAATATSIVSGAVAERCGMTAYFIYAFILAGFVYPVVVHWVWCPEGWLSTGNSDPYFDTGVIDFAGSGVVHLTGGIAAFVGAAILGPRTGRFYTNTDGQTVIKEMPPHTSALQVLGTFILGLGWYAFNGGSTLKITEQGVTLARVCVTTTICASACSLTAVIIKSVLSGGEYDLGYAMNGVLAGLVSITAGCPVVEPWAALLIGIIGAFVYHLSSKLMLYLQIDDVVDAIAVHGFCGIWGVLAVGVFGSSKLVTEVYTSITGEFAKGWVYGGNGNLFGAGLVFIIVNILWTGGFMTLSFGLMSFFGILRVSQKEEEEGLDLSHHGGSAYNNDNDSKKETEMAFSWFGFGK